MARLDGWRVWVTSALLAACAGCTVPPSTSDTGPTTTTLGADPVLAFDQGDFVWLADEAGSWQLARGERPAWSPDGARVSYLRDGDLFVVGVDGAGEQQLTDTPEEEHEHAWSPDGTQLVYVRPDGEGFDELWIVDDDGSSPQPITEMNSLLDSPHWGAAGIVFEDKGVEPWALRLLSAPGSSPQLFAQHDIYLNDPHWSFDGQLIVLSGFVTNDNQEIFTLTPDGLTLERLTDRPGDDDEGSLSPDGSVVLFESDRSGLLDLWVMQPDGSDPIRWLDQAPDQPRRRPTWRPGP
ncbi:MAG: DPP IV N-terminal domain-containing protein [Myxococcales bacterium]|nr:DPP IV N-terminal domain-containing protein [Myxococcales bacterium]